MSSWCRKDLLGWCKFSSIVSQTELYGPNWSLKKKKPSTLNAEHLPVKLLKNKSPVYAWEQQFWLMVSQPDYAVTLCGFIMVTLSPASKLVTLADFSVFLVFFSPFYPFPSVGSYRHFWYPRLLAQNDLDNATFLRSNEQVLRHW